MFQCNTDDEAVIANVFQFQNTEMAVLLLFSLEMKLLLSLSEITAPASGRSFMLLKLIASFRRYFIPKTCTSFLFFQTSQPLLYMFCLRTPHPCQADLKSSGVNQNFVLVLSLK